MRSIFASTLYSWHSSIERDLPWKESGDPYKIWVSEIILQQTRVAQGIPYYQRFISRFPDIQTLADAREDELMAVWKGLGYYSRARNMHKAAKKLVADHKASIPADYASILSLPGIGPYTAAAISSFAFDLPYHVIDGNVKRVISRYFGITDPVDTSGGHRNIDEKLSRVFDSEDPARFNQAMMDFGALQCRPKNPDCNTCPFNNDCVAYEQELTDQLPLKVKKLKRKSRHFHYFVITTGDTLVLKKRKGNDIWKSLYEPLLYEKDSSKLMDPNEQLEFLNQYLSLNGIPKVARVEKKKQVLSHQDIHAVFYSFHFEDLQINPKVPVELVKMKNLSNFAVPRIVDWYLTDFSIPLDR